MHHRKSVFNPAFYVLIIIIACGLTDCQQPDGNGVLSEEPYITKSTDLDTNYFEEVNIQYARNFTVSYHGNYKLVTTSATLGDWGNAGGDRMDLVDKMVLVQKGTKVPELTGELEGASIVMIPASKIASNNAVLEIWIEMLGLYDQQVAVGGTKTFDDAIRNKVNNGEIGEIGYYWAEPPNLEVVLDRKPDIVLSSISRIDFNTALKKLRQFDIPCAPVFDWAEEDYMARAEWIKYISIFFNLENRATELFSEIEQKVEDLKELATSVENHPNCLWGHYVDNGFFMANANNAEARFLRDAGVVNPIQDFTLPFNPVGEPFTSEQWLEIGYEVEHWIISQGTMTLVLPSDNYLNSFSAWRDDNLYHHYKRSKPKFDVYDWYNLSIARPDLVLADLIALFHPQLLPDHNFIFFSPITKEELNG